MTQWQQQHVAVKNAGCSVNDHLAFVNTHRKAQPCNVETSTKCPLHCPQCTRAKLQLPKDTQRYKEIKNKINAGSDLSLADAEKILNFFEYGVLLCGQLSDPVYWPHLFEFLKLSSAYSSRSISIHTAASKGNIEWYRSAFELCGKNITWKFGIDGLEDTAPLYRVGQDSKLMFEVMILGKSMGINIEWHYIVFCHNEHQVENARRLVEEHGISLYLVKSDRTGGGVAVPINWKPARNKEILK